MVRTDSLISRWLLSCACLLAPMFNQPALAQQPAKIDLGMKVITFAPELEIPLPLTINAPGEGLVSISVDVGYPSTLLTFVGAKPSGSVEAKSGKVSAAEKAGAGGPDEKVVTIEVMSPQPLTLGGLATLTFKVTEKTTHGTEIVIKNMSRTTKTASGQTTENQGTDGKITLPAAIPACFFFMH